MTKHDWASGLRWMRDKFAGWLASVTVFTFLWVAVGVAVAVLFVWDGVWSRHQAPSSLDPLTFQAAGWVMRLWTVFGLAAALWCFRHAARWVGIAFLVTWLMTSVMTYGHALGFMMAGQAEKYASGAVAEKTLEINTTSSADRIATLERQKEGIRADRDADVQKFEAAINNITSDGLNNDDLADVYRQDIADTQASARARIEAIDADINAILSESKSEQVAGQEAVAVAAKFDPLYLTLAEWTDGKDGRPDDEAARAIAQKTGAFWAFLIEMVGGLGVALLYAVHAHMATRKDVETGMDTVSGEAPEGSFDLRFTQEEWDAYERAMSEQKKRDAEEAKKRSDAAKNRAPIPIAHKGWVREKKAEINRLEAEGKSAQEICEETGFATWNEFEVFVRKMYNKKRAAEILGEAQAEPDHRAATPRTVGDYMPEPTPETSPPDSEMGGDISKTPEETTDLNGGEVIGQADSPQEPEAPQNYGVALYEPPANPDEDEEEAA